MRLTQPTFWAKKAPKPWFWPFLLALSALYALGARGHKLMAGSPRLLSRAVCIGNAIAGGAGKTPTLIALSELLGRDNVVFLTRGYGGSEHGPILVDPAIHSAADVGDEALLLARHAPTIVAKDRIAGYDIALTLSPNTLILMDDGMQNPHFRAELNLLVWDGFGAGNGYTLPAGPLRQPLTQTLSACDAILTLDDAVPPTNSLPVFHAIGTIPRIEDHEPVLAFAGIGRPAKFETSLRENGYNLAYFYPFPDHHIFSEGEMEALAAHGLPMLTTEKDHVRLSPAMRALIRAVPYRLTLSDPDALKRWIHDEA